MYQSPFRSREPILCYNKPRWDFFLKQRPALAYYNKGSARFITTKTFFAYVVSRKWRSTERKKNFGAMSPRWNKTNTTKFSYFWTLSKMAKKPRGRSCSRPFNHIRCMNEFISNLSGFRVLNSKLEHDCNITNRSQVHLTGHFITTVFRFALHNCVQHFLEPWTLR